MNTQNSSTQPSCNFVNFLVSSIKEDFYKVILSLCVYVSLLFNIILENEKNIQTSKITHCFCPVQGETTCNESHINLETAEHFFLQCSRFNIQRIELFRATRKFHPIDINFLLFGSSTATLDENSSIFISIQAFISQTHRF